MVRSLSNHLGFSGCSLSSVMRVYDISILAYVVLSMLQIHFQGKKRDVSNPHQITKLDLCLARYLGVVEENTIYTHLPKINLPIIAAELCCEHMTWIYLSTCSIWKSFNTVGYIICELTPKLNFYYEDLVPFNK